jgi:hypothetical protein
VEYIIRDIIRILIREPLIKAFLEEELSKFKPADNIELSSLVVDEACNIYLTDFDNTKIEIKGYQAKTLYLFYLLSPAGVSNRDLPSHYDIIKNIYKEVCHQKMNDEYRSEVVIKGLLFREGAISEATNKIRAAVKKAISSTEISHYYMINGLRNGVRQIPIRKSLIRIENKQLIQVKNKWRFK